MRNPVGSPWWRNPHETASGKTGAIHQRGADQAGSTPSLSSFEWSKFGANRLSASRSGQQKTPLSCCFSGVLCLEIGRASCRARGCQYVSISVVAVSLKNKRNAKDEALKYMRNSQQKRE